MFESTKFSEHRRVLGIESQGAIPQFEGTRTALRRLLAQARGHQGRHHARNQRLFELIRLGQEGADLFAPLAEACVTDVAAQFLHHGLHGRIAILGLAG